MRNTQVTYLKLLFEQSGFIVSNEGNQNLNPEAFLQSEKAFWTFIILSTQNYTSST